MSGDQYKGFMDFRSDRPDQGPRFPPLYIAVVTILLAAVLVSWLGWTWLAFAVFVVTMSVVIGGWVYLRIRSRRLGDERRAALLEGDRWAEPGAHAGSC